MTTKLLEEALTRRDKDGVKSATAWLAEQGIPEDLGVLVLVGSYGARLYSETWADQRLIGGVYNRGSK